MNFKSNEIERLREGLLNPTEALSDSRIDENRGGRLPNAGRHSLGLASKSTAMLLGATTFIGPILADGGY